MQMHSHTLNTQHASFTNGLRQPGLAARVASVPARLCMHLNASSSSPGSTTEDAERLKQRIRRVRLFRSTDSTDGDAPAAAAAAAQPAAEAARPVPVSEEFRQAFEDLGVQPIGVKNLGQAALRQRAAGTDSTRDEPSSSSSSSIQPRRRSASAAAAEPDFDDDDDRPATRQAGSRDSSSSSSSRDRAIYREGDRDSYNKRHTYRDKERDSYRERDRDSYSYRERDRGQDRPSFSGSRQLAYQGPKASQRSWEGRGSRSSAAGPGRDENGPEAAAANARQRSQWEAEAAERQRLADEEERKRLLRKARSERIPTQPKRNQDPVIFQALTREWDEKTSLEEKRGARAAARKVARVGLYDRNKSLRTVRRKLMQSTEAATDPEVAALAASAARQVQEAASKAIQKSKEELAQEAAGVKRDFSRAEALPEGEWERLKVQYKANQPEIKIGRRGASPALIGQIQAMWRGREVAKLVIHDEKSARKMNLPRINLLLKELEERTGTGVVIDAAGSSIWLYRGIDWAPVPVPPPYKPPPPHELFTQQHTPRGTWLDIAGISCYLVGSSEAAGLTSPPSSSSSSEKDDGSSSSSSGGEQDDGSSSGSSAAGDQMTVLLLPDQFSMAETPMLMQLADRAASKGALVILADLLGPPASHPYSSVATRGAATVGSAAGYWRIKWWPIVKKRKLEYFDWYGKGPGSWEQQRPKLQTLLEALQEQGLYDKHAAAAGEDAQESSSSSSGEQQQDSSRGVQQQDSSSDSSGGGQAGRPLGVLGLGWGNYIAFRAAGDPEFVAAGIRAVAAISPVTFMKDLDLATALKLPVCLLPAKYDPMEQMMLTIDLLQRLYAKRCCFKRFGKVKPGWAHWLPQWIDNRAMYQAAEQLLMAVAYLKRELLDIPDDSLPPPLVKGDAAAAAAAAEAAEAEADSEAEADGEEQQQDNDDGEGEAEEEQQEESEQ